MATKKRVGRPDITHTTEAAEAIVSLAKYLNSVGKKVTASRIGFAVYGPSLNSFRQEYIRSVLTKHGIPFQYTPHNALSTPLSVARDSSIPKSVPCQNFVVTTDMHP